MKLAFPFLIIFIAFCSCTNNNINSRLDVLTERMDELEKNPFGISLHPEDKTYSYSWFELGKEHHQIVDELFYVSNVSTSFRENGIQVVGTIGNLTSMSILTTTIECAIKDTTLPTQVLSGSSELPILFSGDKISFSVFIPTTKKDVSKVGVWVSNYRM